MHNLQPEDADTPGAADAGPRHVLRLLTSLVDDELQAAHNPEPRMNAELLSFKTAVSGPW
jgi:hypothetical protein